MGFSRLCLVAPRSFPHAEACAFASGAFDVLATAQVTASLTEALAGVTHAVAFSARRRDLATQPVWLREAMTEAATCYAHGQEVALVFGNEQAGLANEELALCPRWAMIPTDAEYSSLNLAQAVQLACYELRLAALSGLPPPASSGAGPLASIDEVTGLLAHWQRAAIVSGFLDAAAPRRLMPRLQRLFNRARLEKVEVNILRGMLAAWEQGFPAAPPDSSERLRQYAEGGQGDTKKT